MNNLENIIITEIRKHGPMTFDRFMDLALYHPEHGYYGGGKSNIGRDGDFYTSPVVHRAFGQVIAGFIARTSELIGTDQLNVVEIGAGKGLLSLDILDTLKTEHNEIYQNLQYTVVEHGDKQSSAPKELLSKHNKKIAYKTDIQQLKSGIEGIVISNEFFDSLPFHRLKLIGGKIREIYVTYKDNKLTEEPGEISNTRLTEYIERYGIHLHKNQEIEINLRAASMLKKISSVLKSGSILTIDYGYLTDELYTPDRPRGTFKCHYRHTINENPYQNIGNQDITSHVDFTNLIETGRVAGFNEYIFSDQGQFLVDWGILEIIESTCVPDNGNYHGQKERLTIKNLVLPQFMGKVFKVLIQFKNTENPHQGYYPESDLKLV